MALDLVYLPLAEADLDAIDDWIAERADPHTAFTYVSRIQGACHALTDFPGRGTPHDDLEPGLRSIAFRRRATIYYRVTEAVEIVRVLYAGMDPERAFRP